MKARLIAVGTGMPGWVNTGYDEYAKRLSHWLPLELIEIEPGSRGKHSQGKPGDSQRALIEEGARTAAALPKQGHIVVLDSQGKPYSSEQLAARLQHWRMLGKDLAFLIGGPDGFAPETMACADEHWSLGPLTLPHALVRIVVAEQLYRAASLLAGHPYHRGR